MVNRRGMFGCLLAAICAPFVARADSKPRIEGVGVLTYPDEVYDGADGQRITAQECALKIADQIKAGGVLCLPTGWDFRIEGGDFDHQVKVVTQCTRAYMHDGPCNGLPCHFRRQRSA